MELESLEVKILDQPERLNDKPGGRTIFGDASNSITDWLRVLNLQKDDDNYDDCFRDDDRDDDDCPSIVGISSNNNMCTSWMGPGLSQGHCLV